MIKLTDRLKAMADEVTFGETVADIGTDHGFLPIYLWESGISPKVIMADISKGSLQKAEDNCTKLHPDVKFDLRLGSGIEVLNEGEVDVVIIAGMGGILMTEILGSDLKKAHSYKKIVLQPRTQIGPLRHWLYNNGFSITNEKLVREGRFICEIITAIPKEVAVTRSLHKDRIEYQYPHSLIDYATPLTKEYLSNKLNSEQKVLCSMEKSNKIEPNKLRNQKYRVEYLERLMSQL